MGKDAVVEKLNGTHADRNASQEFFVLGSKHDHKGILVFHE